MAQTHHIHTRRVSGAFLIEAAYDARRHRTRLPHVGKLLLRRCALAPLVCIIPRYLPRTLPEHVHPTRSRPPLAELHPQPSSTGRHSQSGGRGDRVPAQGEARAGAGDDGCRCRAKIHLPRLAPFGALVNLAFLRRRAARDLRATCSRLGLRLRMPYSSVWVVEC